MGKTADKPNLTECPNCHNKPHAASLGLIGTHVGSGGTLGGNIMEKFYPSWGKSAKDHPLSIPKQTGYDIAQAHHLICSESLNNDEWALVCANFGYDINSVENGVFLPADTKVACQQAIPLHRGNHGNTETEETPPYVETVKNLIETIKDDAIDGDYCAQPKEVIDKLNKISSSLWNDVKLFTLILTFDGRSFLAGQIGCGNHHGVKRKRDDNSDFKNCSQNRFHNIAILPSEYFKER